jgi:hypothetical protein
MWYAVMIKYLTGWYIFNVFFSPSLNLGRLTGNLDWGCCGFSQHLYTNFGIVPWSRSQAPPSKSSLNHHVSNLCSQNSVVRYCRNSSVILITGRKWLQTWWIFSMSWGALWMLNRESVQCRFMGSAPLPWSVSWLMLM